MSYKGTYEGKSLKHYRTKGSRNGYSKDPNYKPIGQPAKGDIPSAARPDGYNERRQAQEAWAQRMSNMQNNAMAGVRSQKSTSIPSFKRGDYQTAQAQAMERRRAAEAKVSAAAAAGAKNQALQRAKNKSVGTPGRINTSQPNKGDYGKPKSQQQLVEERRIAGGSQVGNSQNETNRRRIQGSAMTKNAAQRQKETEERRIKGGNYGSTARKTGINSQYDAQAVQRQKDTNRTNYRAMVNRRKAEENRAGITANRAAAEQRRIAGSKLGSKYEDRGEGNFRRGASLAKQAFKEATHKRYYHDYGRGHSSSDRAADHAKLAVKEIATGTAKAAKSLVKKGRKKVKKLMKRMFG